MTPLARCCDRVVELDVAEREAWAQLFESYRAEVLGDDGDDLGPDAHRE